MKKKEDAFGVPHLPENYIPEKCVPVAYCYYSY